MKKLENIEKNIKDLINQYGLTVKPWSHSKAKRESFFHAEREKLKMGEFNIEKTKKTKYFYVDYKFRHNPEESGIDNSHLMELLELAVFEMLQSLDIQRGLSCTRTCGGVVHQHQTEVGIPDLQSRLNRFLEGREGDFHSPLPEFQTK